MAKLGTWWKTRTPREQKLLIAGGFIAFVVLAWLLIVRPMGDALANAKERHNDAVATLSDVRADLAALERSRGAGGAAASGPVDAVVSAAAAEAGFPVSRLDRPNPGEATLVLDAVRPQAFFAWIGRMEAERGLRIERLSVSANTDRTLAAQVTFRARTG